MVTIFVVVDILVIELAIESKIKLNLGLLILDILPCHAEKKVNCFFSMF